MNTQPIHTDRDLEQLDEDARRIAWLVRPDADLPELVRLVEGVPRLVAELRRLRAP